MQSSSSAARSRRVPVSSGLLVAVAHDVGAQEFRKELQEAETKDKKFIKRKTALKKIVANITMGNDSAHRVRRRSCAQSADMRAQCRRCSRTLCNVSSRPRSRSRRVRTPLSRLRRH